MAAKKAEALVAGDPMPDDVAAEWAQADELVLSKLREKLGLEQVRHAVSGAAPIPKETLAFFLGLGIPISEVWGMSELSCIATVSHPSETRLGTVGKLVPGMEGRIAEDGEFLVRGPLVMKGYRKEPQKTAEAVDEDGWLHTGDVMEADEDGYLKIVDRKKELIINAAGKNMSPANIENSIKAACPLVGVVLAVGDARPYNTALIVLDAESAGPYAAQRGLDDASPEALAADPDLIADIAAGVADGNTKLSKVEQIKRFRVLPTFWEPGGDEITLTMKLKRKPIHQKYGAEIDELYASDIADAVHEPKSATSASAMTSRHISVWIDAAPEVVYAIGADPEQLPRWASGLAEGAAAADRGRLGGRFADGRGDRRVRAGQRVRGARPRGADALGRGGVQPAARDPGRGGSGGLRGGVHRATQAGHDRRGVRERRRHGGRRSGPAATAGGGLAARTGDAQAEPGRRCLRRLR